MTIRLAPPPLNLPPDFALSKEKNAFFSSLTNTIYQLWSTVFSTRQQAKVKTTDATPTTLVRIEASSEKTTMIIAKVVARRTGGSSGSTGDSAFYTITGAYKNVGGVLTGIGSPHLISGEDQAGWNVQLASGGLDIEIVVTGAANNNITWEGVVENYVVGV